MSTGLYSHTTRASGTVLTATIYNSDHVNHITNQNPQQTGAYSDNVSQMRSQVDPGEQSSESLAGSLAGELERLRYAIAELKGMTYWYETAPNTLNGGATIVTVNTDTTLAATAKGRIHNVTAKADVTLPAASALNTGDVIRIKSSTEQRVRVVAAGTDTIDGDANYLLPSYTSCEVMKSAAGAFILSSKPSSYIGEMTPFGGSSAPRGFVLADGSAKNRTNQGGLFEVYGTTHGAGDGSTTFGIPNVQRRVVVGAGGSGTGTLGNAVGNTGGEETHVLTVSETPAHAHPGSTFSGSGSGNVQTDSTATGTAGSIGAMGSNHTDGLLAPVSVSVSGSVSVASQGGGAAHNIMQPSYVMNFIIKT